jgi:hypothetical protein
LLFIFVLFADQLLSSDGDKVVSVEPLVPAPVQPWLRQNSKRPPLSQWHSKRRTEPEAEDGANVHIDTGKISYSRL